MSRWIQKENISVSYLRLELHQFADKQQERKTPTKLGRERERDRRLQWLCSSVGWSWVERKKGTKSRNKRWQSSLAARSNSRLVSRSFTIIALHLLLIIVLSVCDVMVGVRRIKSRCHGRWCLHVWIRIGIWSLWEIVIGKSRCLIAMIGITHRWIKCILMMHGHHLTLSIKLLWSTFVDSTKIFLTTC